MREKGNRGEAIARKYLKDRGFKILATNFFARVGEIDIVAKDKDTIVFVEVKTRTSAKFGTPAEAITPKKLQKIQLAAMIYLRKACLSEAPIRFDAVEVLPGEINHLTNITF